MRAYRRLHTRLHAALRRVHAGGELFTPAGKGFGICFTWESRQVPGVAGPIFDWLPRLYCRMSYAVRLNGTYLEQLLSKLGTLTGDPGAPFCFVVYFSTFEIPDNIDMFFKQ